MLAETLQDDIEEYFIKISEIYFPDGDKYSTVFMNSFERRGEEIVYRLDTSSIVAFPHQVMEGIFPEKQLHAMAELLRDYNIGEVSLYPKLDESDGPVDEEDEDNEPKLVAVLPATLESLKKLESAFTRAFMQCAEEITITAYKDLENKSSLLPEPVRTKFHKAWGNLLNETRKHTQIVPPGR